MDSTVINVICWINSFEQSQGTLNATAMPSASRLVRAAMYFGIFFGLAFLGALVPILHFVLVPSLVGIAMWISWRTYNAKFSFEPLKLECPHCHAPLQFAPQNSNLPFKVVCGQCAMSLNIKAAP